jgi:UDP-3-O-[3-hydroxymyristoyl] N-acetylglucosamine deacetylase
VSVVVDGRGLHGGHAARVTLAKGADGAPTTLNGVALAAWRAVPAERSTMLVTEVGAEARTVEHLFAALASRGLHRGVALTLEGPEPPILDGCAAQWIAALDGLGDVAPSPPGLVVVREEEVRVATSTYRFMPGGGTRVSVELELGDDRFAREAAWDGDAADFRARVATARTFCFAHEVEELARRGLASHVTPDIVIVIGPLEVLAAGAPAEPDEPARHKLLDLVGDLFLYGGPPRGQVHARRPGHWATHEAIRVAFERGALARA